VAEGLVISGCNHSTIGSIVRGHFSRLGENHGRPTFKKTTQANGLDVMLYFWDDRDGPALCGWWFGPKVGGDQVWAFHNSNDVHPPASGWMVPFNGPIDNTLQVQRSQTGASSVPRTVTPQVSAVRGQRVQPPAMLQRSSVGTPPQSQALQATQEAKQRQADDGFTQLRQSLHEEEMRAKQEEMRWKMEENKKRIAETNRIRKEAQEAEMKKKVEEQKQRLEEMRRKKEEEDKARILAAQKKGAELKAMNAIRQAQQKVRVAVFQNYDQARSELEEVLDRERPNLNDKAETIQNECETLVANVQKRIDSVKEQKRKEEDRKHEEVRKRQEQEQRALELLDELKGHIEDVEGRLAKLKEEADNLSKKVGLNTQQAEAKIKAVVEASKEAEALAQSASEFLRNNHAMMKLAPTVKVDGEQGMAKDTRQVLSAFLQRIALCKREAGAAVEKSAKVKFTLLTRAKAQTQVEEIEALFKRYDKDLDGMLSKRELTAFAQSEYKFSIPEATLDLIWEHYTEYSPKFNDTGVPPSGFGLAKCALGVARELQRDVKRRKEAEVRKQRFNEAKAQLLEKIKTVAESITEADQSVSKAEEDVKPLATKSKGLRVAQMKALADEIREVCDRAREAVNAAQQKMASLKEGLGDDFKGELTSFFSSETKKHDSRLGRMDGRINRSVNLLARFEDEVGKKRTLEVEKVRASALRVMRYNQQLKSLSDEELFGKFDADGDGVIGEVDFQQFFAGAELTIRPLPSGDNESALTEGATEEANSAEKLADGKKDEEVMELLPEDLADVFVTLCQLGEKHISQEEFFCVLPQYMIVVKQTAMTDGLCIKDSKTLRRLELDEIVKVVKGPLQESATKVMRTLIKALKDDAEGWVSPTGNAGTIFLKEGGRQFKVMKENVLTETFELDGEASKANEEEALGEVLSKRKLKPGEVLDALVWPRTDSSGLVRLKVRAQSDHATGWVTVVGNQAGKGPVYLKAI